MASQLLTVLDHRFTDRYRSGKDKFRYGKDGADEMPYQQYRGQKEPWRDCLNVLFVHDLLQLV
jgi:hypothetical protein